MILYFWIQEGEYLSVEEKLTQEAFNDMPKWQRDMFIAELSDEARDTYKTLGYDLSFGK